jgi:hypothetical protein
LFSFAGVVLEEFFDQVDVREDHAAAAVALETDGVESIAGRNGLVGGGVEGTGWVVRIEGVGVVRVGMKGERRGLTLLPHRH